ncbi:MAG: AAA family ATPase [Desulfosarcina sp.]|nr:AAA family ATPase [Desulfosarcina sp.]MBC2742862.1 AAA family ATPase [Desulfosarcina sp.]MBC2765772.1 AAA family ATPase [Desulfosarcina sp.]
MKLKKVQITNFRCFESLDVPLQPDVNVFVGINGAGKSSILDAIAIALYDIVAANGGGGKRERKKQGVTLTPADIHISPETRDAVKGRKDFVQVATQACDFYEVPGFSSRTNTGMERRIEWTERIRYTPPFDFSYDTQKAETLSSIYDYFSALWQELKKSEATALIPLPVVAYYRADRRLREMPDLGDIFKLRFERSGAFKDALNAGADYQAMCQWFYLRENSELREKLQVREDRSFEFSDLRAIRTAIISSLEHVGSVTFKDNPPSMVITLEPENGPLQELDIEQLSDGYRNLLALILDFARRLAQAHPGWENPLKAPGILMIDEIELHLHPGWQQRIIPDLRTVFPNTQLIIATHSPQVLTTVKREQVHFLTADHTLEPLPDDVGTYGAESGHVLEAVFGVQTRPRTVETVRKLQDYLHLIENRQGRTQNALALRAELERAVGSSDPALLTADMRIRQIEILGKKR